MPNCGGRTIRAHSPYWRNASPARKRTVASRPNESQATQTSNQIEEQLLLTLVQSLPSCGMEAVRSHSSCPPLYRRGVRSNSCGRPLQSKSPVRFQTMQGMAVRQVSGRDRTAPKAAEPVKPFVPYSIEAFLKRRRESAMARAKAREAEYEKIPRAKGGNKPDDSPIERSSPQVSHHSSKDVSQMSSPKSSEKGSQDVFQRSTPKGSQDVSPRITPKSSQDISPRSSTKSSEKISQEESSAPSSPKNSVEISDHGSQNTLQKSSPRSSQKSSEEMSKIGSQISQRSSPKSSQKSIEEISKHSSQNTLQKSSPRSSQKSSGEMSKIGSQISQRSSPKGSQKSIEEISKHSSQNTLQKSSPRSSQKSSGEMSKIGSQISQRSSPKGSQKSIEEISKHSSQRSTPRNSGSNKWEEDGDEQEEEESQEPVESLEPEEPLEPIEVAKEAVETQTPPREEEEQEEQPNEKIFPSFRGEYPTRHRQDSYQWFQAAVPNCGNIVTICDEEQQMLGQAEIVTACEVTEAHFLAMDDNAPDLSPVAPCNKCGQIMYGYPQQQQEQQPQQPGGNWFGSSFRPQPVPCRQQQAPCRQQKPSFVQHPRPCMQQQKPCMQQRRSKCRQSPPNKVCWKCQDQQQQRALQGMQQPQQMQPNGLTEMLAEELKQQMQEAQAQIAKVQLQLDSACGATRLLPQAGNDSPGFAPTAQFRSPITAEQNEGNEEEVNENLTEDARLSEQQEQPMPRLGFHKSKMHFSAVSGHSEASPHSGQQQMQFGIYPVPLAMPNQSPSFQAMPCPCQQQHPASFPSQQAPPCQQQRPPCQQQRPPCQQQLPCQQQRPPCQQQLPCQQQRPPCQQQQPALPSQQKQQEPPQNQNQKPNQNPSPSPPNMYAYGPPFCPSWCCQRYAQMRFMMPRCWPR